MSSQLSAIKRKILPILQKNKIKKAGIFGSYAKGKEKKKSDIDIIISPPVGLGFGFVGIKYELEKILGKKVDLVTYNGLHKSLKKKILEEEVRIYERKK